MLLKLRLPMVAALLSLSWLFVSCTDDEPAPEEPVQPTVEEQPEIVAEEPPPAETSFDAQPVYFAFDDYTLGAQAQGRLSDLADFLRTNTSAMVQIEGHADERGSNEYNLALGERRAQSVKNYLVDLGVDASRLTTISYGEEKPVADGHDEQAWSQNRRAEFVINQ